jgi:hypothetical protein
VVLWLFLTDQRLIETSSYPLIDFAYKTKVFPGGTATAFGQPTAQDFLNRNDKGTRHIASSMWLTVRGEILPALSLRERWQMIRKPRVATSSMKSAANPSRSASQQMPVGASR